MLDALGQAAVSHQIVLTKADEVKPAELAARIAEAETALAKRPAAFPAVLATSARDGAGIAELRAAVALARRRPIASRGPGASCGFRNTALDSRWSLRMQRVA